MADDSFQSWIGQVLGIDTSGLTGVGTNPYLALPAAKQYNNFADAVNQQVGTTTAMSDQMYDIFQKSYWPVQSQLLGTLSGGSGSPGTADVLGQYFTQARKGPNVNRRMGIAESGTKQGYKQAMGQGLAQTRAAGLTPEDQGFMNLLSNVGIGQANDVATARTGARRSADMERLQNLQAASGLGTQGLNTITNPAQAAASLSGVATSGAAGGSSAATQLSIGKSQQKAADQASMENMIMQAAMLAMFAL